MPIRVKDADTGTHILYAGPAGGGDAAADAKTAARLRELEEAKTHAVAEEDYDEAKRLKHAIDKLKAVAAQLSDLEARWVFSPMRDSYLHALFLMSIDTGWQTCLPKTKQLHGCVM
jgi:hypothetical protein